MEMMTQLGDSGRITVPARIRKALGLEKGDEIVLRVEDGTLRLIPLDLAVRLTQEVVRRYVPEGTSLVDELLRERRQEAERE